MRCGFTSHLVLRIHIAPCVANSLRRARSTKCNKSSKNPARCIGLCDKYKQVTSGPGRRFAQFGPVRKFEQGWAQVPPATWARPARAPRATRTPEIEYFRPAPNEVKHRMGRPYRGGSAMFGTSSNLLLPVAVWARPEFRGMPGPSPTGTSTLAQTVGWVTFRSPR